MKLTLLLLVLLWTTGTSICQSIDPTFQLPTPYASGDIHDIHFYSEDQILIIGDISNYNTTNVNGIILTDLEGNIDQSFEVEITNFSNFKSVEVLSDGSIVILMEDRLYKLNGEGNTMDSVVFDSENWRSSMAVHSDDIFIARSGETIYKYDADLIEDESFTNPVISGSLNNLVFQGESLIIMGDFIEINNVAKNDLARLHKDGTLDESFDTGEGTTNIVNNAIIDDEGRIIITESYIANFADIPYMSGTVRLNADGSLDQTFGPPRFNGTLREMAFQGDKILVSAFYYDGTAPTHKVLRLTENGILDDSFIEIETKASHILANDEVIFTTTPLNRYPLKKYLADGNQIENFKPEIEQEGYYHNAAIGDDYIILSGRFHRVENLETFQLCKIGLESGELDESFSVSDEANPFYGQQYRPFPVYIQNDWIYAPLHFNVLKVDQTGTPDPSFSRLDAVSKRGYDTDDTQYANGLTFLGDSTIIVNGDLGLYALDENGIQDMSFEFENTAYTAAFTSVIKQDDHLLFGSSYGELNGQPIGSICRLNIDGTLDEEFQPETDSAYAKTFFTLLDDSFLATVNSDIGEVSSPFQLYKFNSNGQIDIDFVNNLNESSEKTGQAQELIALNDYLYLLSYNNPQTAQTNLIAIDAEGNLDDLFELPNELQLPALKSSWSETIGLEKIDDKSFLMLVNHKFNNQISFGHKLIRNISPNIEGLSEPILIDEDSSVQLSLDNFTILDPDNDAEDFTLAILDGDNYVAEEGTIYPEENYFGELTINVQVSDGLDVSDVFEFNLPVNPVNDAPIIDQINLGGPFYEDSIIHLTSNLIEVTDPDNEYPIDFEIEIIDNENYTVNGSDIILSQDYFGEIEITILVNDGELNSDPFGISLTIEPINDAPVILSQEDITIEEDNFHLFSMDDINFSDVDSEEIEYVLESGSDFTISGDTILPATNFYGEIVIPLQLSDGDANSDVFEFKINVLPVNDIPFIEEQASIEIDEDSSYKFSFNDITIIDPDNTLEDFSLTLTQGENYSIHNDTIIPAENFNGIVVIPISITDGAANSNTFDFTIEVLPINDKPAIISFHGNYETVSGGTILIDKSDFELIDPDNPQEEISLVIIASDNYQVDNNRVTFNEDIDGNISVLMFANDGQDQSDEFEILVDVKRVLSSHIPVDLLIYPNPARTYILVEGKSITHFELIDFNGKLLLEGPVNANKRIELPKLTNGTYLIRCFLQGGSIVRKKIILE